MIGLDGWVEILDTLRRNKLRTLLTGVSVAWGIFMLVVLLGLGNGLANGAEDDFRDDAVNSLWMWAGQTSRPHEGHAVGRRIQLTNADYEAIGREIAAAEHITGRFWLRDNLSISYRDKTSAFSVRAVHPAHRHLEKTIVTRGRFLDELDQAHRRKVAVIGEPVAEFLFGDVDPLGEWIQITGILYRVVGVFTDEGSARELEMLYIPISTAQMAYSGTDKLNQLMFTIADEATDDHAAIERRTRALLAERHHYHPSDRRALRLRNNVEQYRQISGVLTGIRLFVWGVGIVTVLAGIVGVSNIMLIAVKERTREIGVRKALGATPASIVALIVSEAVLITAVFGYLGLVGGVALLELLSAHATGLDFLRDPEVDLSVALYATGLLVAFGALAGFFPAWRAARIHPVEALRDE